MLYGGATRVKLKCHACTGLMDIMVCWAQEQLRAQPQPQPQLLAQLQPQPQHEPQPQVTSVSREQRTSQ